METYNHPYTQLRQDMHAWQCTWPMEQSNGVLNMDVGIDAHQGTCAAMAKVEAS